jgi:hypothetical protein
MLAPPHCLHWLLESLTVVLANSRPVALLALPSLAVVLTDARPAALLALPSYAVVLADACPAAFPEGLHLCLMRLCSQMLAPPHCLHASSAFVLADARPAAFLAVSSLTVVLADA